MVGSSNIETQHKLVGGIPTPLKNISQMGVLFPNIPNIWKNKSHVPNHQPVNHPVL
jgi:hypothetical protein